jgi:hypothetical protein
MERGVSPLKIPYTSVRKGKRYFEPRGRMLEHGFEPKSLGPDNELPRRAAWLLIEQWRAIREGGPLVYGRRRQRRRRRNIPLDRSAPLGGIGSARQNGERFRIRREQKSGGQPGLSGSNRYSAIAHRAR